MAMTTKASSTHVPRSWPSIQRAARQLVNTSIEPTDRSMPPEITITACAIARKARLIVPAVTVRISNAPNLGTWEARQNRSATNSRATPVGQPWRRKKRDSRLLGSGSVVWVSGTGAAGAVAVMPSPAGRAPR